MLLFLINELHNRPLTQPFNDILDHLLLLVSNLLVLLKDLLLIEFKPMAVVKPVVGVMIQLEGFDQLAF